MDGQESGGRSFFRKPGPPGAPPRSPMAPAAPPPGLPPSPPSVYVSPPSGPGPEPPAAATVRHPTFHGTGGTLFGIHVVNVLLTIVTFGIYYFWAKTRIRAYLSGQTEIEGDRFAYHGTARELLLGTIKAVLVFGVPILFLNMIRDVLDVPPPVKVVAHVVSGSLFFVFFPIAMVGARRYRLSRTSWRGIRFSFRGHVRELIKIFLLGSEKFDFSGRGRELFGPFLVAILLTLPTLGLCWVWYVAFKRRYFWDHTTFGSARFSCRVTGGALLGLWVVNLLLLVGTLGIAWPWVRVRNIHFAFRNLALVGALDLARIQQQAQQVGSIGEGLSGFFDSGFDLA